MTYYTNHHGVAERGPAHGVGGHEGVAGACEEVWGGAVHQIIQQIKGKTFGTRLLLFPSTSTNKYLYFRFLFSSMN